MSMKKQITLLALFLMATAAMAAPKDTLRVLAIGNSFSVDAVEQDLYGIADAAGQPIIIGNLFGNSLESHWDCAKNDKPGYSYRKFVRWKETITPKKSTKLSTALADEPWDIITLQQVSQDSPYFETYEPYLNNLIKYIRKHSKKGVKIMWHQTWAYELGDVHSNYLETHFGHSCDSMYRAIMVASRKACDKYGLQVIPTGTAIQNLRTGYTREQTTRDGMHLSTTIGRYTASCVWFEAITGESCIGNTYVPPTLLNYIRRETAQKDAHNAILNPYKVTREDNGPLGQYRATPGGPYNFDEDKVPEYTLPDPLKMQDGTPVTTTEQWMEKRRPELLELFRNEIYGYSAPRQEGQHYKVLSEDRNVFGGLATRREVALYYTDKEDLFMVMLMYIPNDVKGPVPAFMIMNLAGNVSVHSDPGISQPTYPQLHNWGVFGVAPRGYRQDRYPLEMILNRGYALVTFYKGDVDPDYDDGFRNGVQKYIYRPDQTFPDGNQWGSISAWAWGMSRVMDYLETESDIDETKVAVIGHSRGGKTALWAAAQDQRFAMAISNCSGCTGAAISRRKKGETVKAIQMTFPNWFCTNYLKYMDNEDELPVDQHELIALIAPRPVYVASASNDRGADPKGEFLGAVGAMPVYELFGYKGLDSTEFPEKPHSSIGGDHMGYHYREGSHDLLAWDWAHYLDFADTYLK